MSYQLRKYEQNEAPPFSPSGNNRFSVTIGEDNGWANLTKSYLLLDCTISGPDTPYTGFLRIGSGVSAGSAKYMANCLINRCSFKNNNKSLEENNEINKISNSLAHFTKSNEQWEAGEYFGDSGCWVQANQTLLKLPLDSLYGLGQVKAFDCSKYPNSDLYFEMEQNVTVPSMFYVNPTEGTGGGGESGGGSGHPRNVFIAAMADLNPGGDLLTSTTKINTQANFNKLVGVGNQLRVAYVGPDSVEVAKTYLVTSTIWVEDGTFKLKLNGNLPIATSIECLLLDNYDNVLEFDSYTNSTEDDVNLNGTGGIGVTIDTDDWDTNIVVGNIVQLAFRLLEAGVVTYYVYNATILSIADAGGDKTNIKFSIVGGNIIMEALEVVSEISFKIGTADTVDIDDALIDLTVNRASVVVAKLNQEPSDKDKQDSKFYSTWKLESASTNGITDYRKQFDIDSNCVESHILHIGTGQIVGTQHGIESYRMSVNNVDTTNRDVEFDGPLYRDLIQQYIPTKKLNSEIDLEDVARCYIAPQEYPTENVSNVLNYVTNGEMGVNTIHCFKKVVNEL